jgi:hypothetical protein
MCVKNIKMKLPGKSNSLIAVILVSIAILFSGCTIKVPMAPNVGRLEIYNKYPVEAGLLITKETKNYIFKGNPESFTASARPHEFPLGEALEKASSQVFLQVFQKLRLYRTFDEAKKADIIIEPKIEDFHFRYDQLSYAGFSVAVLSKIKVRVTLKNGETNIWERSIESPEQKKGPWVVNMNYERDAGESASDALTYVLKKIALEITEDKSIKNYIARCETPFLSKEKEPAKKRQKEIKRKVDAQQIIEERKESKLVYIPQTTSQMHKESGFKLAIFPGLLNNSSTQWISDKEVTAYIKDALNKSINSSQFLVPKYSYYELKDVRAEKISNNILSQNVIDYLWLKESSSTSEQPNVGLICQLGEKLKVDAILTYYTYTYANSHEAFGDFTVSLINVGAKKAYSEKQTCSLRYDMDKEFKKAIDKLYMNFEKDGIGNDE